MLFALFLCFEALTNLKLFMEVFPVPENHSVHKEIESAEDDIQRGAITLYEARVW